MKASDGYTGGAWDTKPDDTTITGAKTFTYTFTAKTTATVNKAPSAKKLTYNGQAQALVDEGTAEGGTMQYALGADASTAPASGWDTSIHPYRYRRRNLNHNTLRREDDFLFFHFSKKG